MMHSPVLPVACCNSEKWWKVHNHHKFRRREKKALRNGHEMPLVCEVSDVWNSPCDGRTWYGYEALKNGMNWIGHWKLPYRDFGK
jgi:hypothetical protein